MYTRKKFWNYASKTNIRICEFYTTPKLVSFQINERLNGRNILYHSPTVTFLLTSIEQQLVLTNICDVIEENWAIFLFSKYVCVLEKFPIRTKRLSYSYVVVQLNMSLEYMQRCWSYQNRNFSCFENSLEIWRCWSTNYFKECFYNLNFKQTKLHSKLILSKHTLCAICNRRKCILPNTFCSINRWK